MGKTVLAFALVYTTSLAAVQTPPTDANILATVRVTAAVLAGGAPLPSGTYQVRLTEERPTPLPGLSPDTQRWVEFLADGKVIAREIAEVLRDGNLPSEGASSQRVQTGTRVEMLKGGEFLRISIKREQERYLIYLPVMR
jgi:hypothetical protein